MTNEHRSAFGKLFAELYRGNIAATSLSFSLLEFLHLWDDIVDKDFDKVGDPSKIFVDLLTSVAGNPLWDMHIQGCVISCYYRWHAANVFEKDKTSTDDRLAKAWMLRASCYDLFLMIAGKLYGQDWARQCAPMVYDFYGEKLEDFLAEVKNA